MKRFLWISFFLIQISIPLFACESNSDCTGGAQCLRNGEVGHGGVCVGGRMPGNKYDQHPTHSELDASDTIGMTCNHDSECFVSNRRCLKASFGGAGVCI